MEKGGGMVVGGKGGREGERFFIFLYSRSTPMTSI